MSIGLRERVLIEREKRRRKRARLPLLDFIPAVAAPHDPRMAPTHLRPLVEVLERAKTGPIRVAASMPPRHSKTETILHWLVWMLLAKPTLRVAYISFGLQRAWEKSRLARGIAERAGLPLGRTIGASIWETFAGGSFTATAIGGTITGAGFDILVVDDPHKDRAEAESPLILARVRDWFSGTAVNRLEPGGSVVVCHTRWSPNDLIGHITRRAGTLGRFDNISLPAISTTGEALWPERWPLEELALRRADMDNEYDWSSLYMQAPRPRGTTLFQGTRFYSAPPNKRFRVAIGVDLAYSRQTSSDWSVAVVLAEELGVYYVLEVLRLQVSAPQFLAALFELEKRYPGAPVRAYLAGTEKGAADFFTVGGSRIKVMPTNGDKFIRAQPVSSAWNAGKVLLPGRTVPSDDGPLLEPGESIEADIAKDLAASNAPTTSGVPLWVSPFASELCSFTGIADAHDDQVDGLAAAYDELQGATRILLPTVQATPYRTSERGFGF